MTDHNAHADAHAAPAAPARAWHKPLKDHPIFTAAVVAVVLLALVGWYVQKPVTEATVANSTSTPSTLTPEAVKQIAELQARIDALTKTASNTVAPAPVVVATATAPVVVDTPVAANDNQCDEGWQFNGSVCVREARPTKTQVAQSFTAATCKPGETRVIDRKVIENGREIVRRVTQTCGVKS